MLLTFTALRNREIRCDQRLSRTAVI